MATTIEGPYASRAQYYSWADGFNIKRPPVPSHVFLAERDRALEPAAPTGVIPLVLSRPLEPHDEGHRLALSLIAHDGWFPCHGRTMGFSWA